MPVSHTAPMRLSHEAYTVDWLCPLEVELLAAMHMLDEEHEALSQPRGDHNMYTLGSINGHNVVLVGLQQKGNCHATMVVTLMRTTFPNLNCALLVGIGGGVPRETSEGLIRLGHVVVSEPTDNHSGAVQYGRGKAQTGYFEHTGSVARPPAMLLNAANALAVHRVRVDADPVVENIKRIQTHRPGLRLFAFPGADKDYLHQPSYVHRKSGMTCEEAGCDATQRIPRVRNSQLPDSFVSVHRGTIASGELVIRDAMLRDELAKQYDVLCFEMEAAGVLTSLPSLIIRGISDYCDSHKTDEWQGFSSAAAAAYARQLFFHLPRFDASARHPQPSIRPDLMRSIADYASQLRFEGRYEKAEEQCARAWELRRRALGDAHPDTIRCVSDLAAILHDLGRYQQARELAEEAVRQRKAILGNQHADTLESRAVLATIEHSLGHYELFLKLRKDVLTSRITLLGDDDPDTMRSRADISSSLRVLGRYDEATRQCYKSWEQRWRTLGPEHPDTIRWLADRAAIHHDQKQYHAARILGTDALRQCERVLGDTHPDTVNSCEVLANIETSLGNFESAGRLRKMVLESRSQSQKEKA